MHLCFESFRCCACLPPDCGFRPMMVQSERLASLSGSALQNHWNFPSIAECSFLTNPERKVIRLCASLARHLQELDIRPDDWPESHPMWMPASH